MVEWSKNGLPEGRSLINATAVMAGGMLEGETPSPALFQGSILMITSPLGANASAIQLVVDLAELVGSSAAYFQDSDRS